MSASVYVKAHRKVSADDLEYLVAYNALIAIDTKPPEHIIKYLRKALGDDDRLPDEKIEMPTGEMISVHVRGKGDAAYGNGMIVEIANLPPGTVALRIYMD